MHGLSILRSRFFRILYASYAAILLITALLVVFATLLGDILYTIVDPRIRFK